MDKKPIIVIKKKGGHGGHHGGAWKVAYADFVTAMMSLFIVLWLMNSTPQVKQAVAGYFNDPKSSGKETGTAALGAGEAVSIDQQNVEKLKEQIQKAIAKQPDLAKLSKQVEITVTNEGLKIELIEDQGGTFFQSGSPDLTGNGVKLLDMLAGQVETLPNHLLIEGHTDAQPYSSERGYTNWELSADRANSARRLLQQGGVNTDHISQVRGYADQQLRLPDKPLDPSNRRISLIVQWLDAPAKPADGEAGGKSADGKPAASGEGEKSDSSKPEVKSEAKADAKTEDKPADNPQQVAAEKKPEPASASKPAAPASASAKPALMARLQSMMPGKKKSN